MRKPFCPFVFCSVFSYVETPPSRLCRATSPFQGRKFSSRRGDPMWSPGSIAKKYTFLRDATQGVPYAVHLLLPYTGQGKQKRNGESRSVGCFLRNCFAVHKKLIGANVYFCSFGCFPGYCSVFNINGIEQLNICKGLKNRLA